MNFDLVPILVNYKWIINKLDQRTNHALSIFKYIISKAETFQQRCCTIFDNQVIK